MNPFTENLQIRTRRHFMQNCGVGLGAMAMHSLGGNPVAQADEAPNPAAAKRTHFAGESKTSNLLALCRFATTPRPFRLQT